MFINDKPFSRHNFRCFTRGKGRRRDRFKCQTVYIKCQPFAEDRNILGVKNVIRQIPERMFILYVLLKFHWIITKPVHELSIYVDT